MLRFLLAPQFDSEPVVDRPRSLPVLLLPHLQRHLQEGQGSADGDIRSAQPRLLCRAQARVLRQAGQRRVGRARGPGERRRCVDRQDGPDGRDQPRRIQVVHTPQGRLRLHAQQREWHRGHRHAHHHARRREVCQGQGAQPKDTSNRRQIRLTTRTKGYHRYDLPHGGHALHLRGSFSRHHRQSPRHSFPHDRGSLGGVSAGQGVIAAGRRR